MRRRGLKRVIYALLALACIGCVPHQLPPPFAPHAKSGGIGGEGGSDAILGESLPSGQEPVVVLRSEGGYEFTPSEYIGSQYVIPFIPVTSLYYPMTLDAVGVELLAKYLLDSGYTPLVTDRKTAQELARRNLRVLSTDLRLEAHAYDLFFSRLVSSRAEVRVSEITTSDVTLPNVGTSAAQGEKTTTAHREVVKYPFSEYLSRRLSLAVSQGLAKLLKDSGSGGRGLGTGSAAQLPDPSVSARMAGGEEQLVVAVLAPRIDPLVLEKEPKHSRSARLLQRGIAQSFLALPARVIEVLDTNLPLALADVVDCTVVLSLGSTLAPIMESADAKAESLPREGSSQQLSPSATATCRGLATTNPIAVKGKNAMIPSLGFDEQQEIGATMGTEIARAIMQAVQYQ